MKRLIWVTVGFILFVSNRLTDQSHHSSNRGNNIYWQLHFLHGNARVTKEKMLVLVILRIRQLLPLILTAMAKLIFLKGSGMKMMILSM